jgi:hypothetical protein
LEGQTADVDHFTLLLERGIVIQTKSEKAHASEHGTSAGPCRRPMPGR